MIRRPKDASRAETSHINIPVPKGLTLFPYQIAGIEYILSRSNCLLGDEMGLGKSPMSIGVSNYLPDAKKILIVCPASLKLNWQNEWLRWDVKGLTVGVAGKTFPDTDVVIINYDILNKYRGELRTQEWDMLVADEAHFVKSAKTIRARELLGGIKRDENKKIVDRTGPIPARRRLFLTGTPILNKPKDIWPLLKAIDPDGLGADWFTFAKRYCELFEIEQFDTSKGKKVHVGWKWDGAANLEELQTLMRERFMIRRLKKDVLTELPPKTRQVIIIEPKKNLTKLLNQEKLTYDDYINKYGADEIDPPSFSEMSKIMKEVALAKVPYAIEYIQEVLDEAENQKMVVFAHHREAIKSLQDAFPNCSVALTGETSPADRQTAIERFQGESRYKLFIGSIQAAGVGITLTAAQVALFVERSWTPALVTQAEDRLHRIGQKGNVLIRHLVFNGGLDQRQVQTLVKKQEIADKALDKDIK